jgi:transposase
MDGLNRRAVESGQRVHPKGYGERGRARPAVERSTPSFQWHLVDIAHGRALAGLARALRSVSNGASALSALAQARSHRSGPARLGQRFAQTRRTRSLRVLPGRQLYSGQKGGAKVGKTKRGKGCKIMAIGDAHGLPIAIHTEAAAPAEVKLVVATLQQSLVPEKPLRLIADKAYDSDALREQLLEKEVLLLTPHRRGRIKPSFNDGRWLRRYRKRWKIERLFAWLHNFRRLVVRWEYHADNYLAFLQLGCAIILLRHL